jgi:hypothetical protein
LILPFGFVSGSSEDIRWRNFGGSRGGCGTWSSGNSWRSPHRADHFVHDKPFAPGCCHSAARLRSTHGHGSNSRAWGCESSGSSLRVYGWRGAIGALYFRQQLRL